MTKEKSLLFNYLNSINHSKKDYILDPNSEEYTRFKKEYSPFVINTFLAGFPDTIMYASEMNSLYKTSSERQFLYLLYSIRPRKRFTRWRHVGVRPKGLTDVMKYFNISADTAKLYLKVLKEDDLKYITSIVESGYEPKN